VVVIVEFGYFAFYGDWYFIDGVIYLYLDFIVEWYIITSLKWIVLLEKKFYLVFGSTVYFNQKYTKKVMEWFIWWNTYALKWIYFEIFNGYI
jgi:hypothetical protein